MCTRHETCQQQNERCWAQVPVGAGVKHLATETETWCPEAMTQSWSLKQRWRDSAQCKSARQNLDLPNIEARIEMSA